MFVYLLALYAVMSVITFIVYTVDKRRAEKNLWRIPEATLHWLELGFGWPGALLAQRIIRHKSQKMSFRIVFWIMTVLNIAATTALILKIKGLI